jgi:glycine dehydrogenase subunit 1
LRYIPITPADKAEMLKTIGVSSTDELFADIPAAVRLNRPLNLPAPLTEMEIGQHMAKLSGANANTSTHVSFLGAGAYDHYIPSLVNHVLLRGEFLTAYTPYQPEVSQGVLQAIYEYQTMVCELTGMDLSNASMYDGASALAEAAIMAMSQTGRKRLVLLSTVHPDYRATVKTYMSGLGVDLVEVPMYDGVVDLAKLEAAIDDNTAAVLLQTPNFFGCLEPVHEVERLIHAKGGLFVVAVDPISLGVLAAPAEYNADIVVAEGQSLGNPTSFGGPYVGLMATREKFARRIPGRIVGQTVDNRGQRAFVLTLQAREQHIRREKATSNICTNQALNALAATVYLTMVGKQGLKEIANACLQKAHYAQRRITAQPGYKPAFSAPFFKEFTVCTPGNPKAINANLLQQGIIGGYNPAREYPELANCMIFAVTEKRTREEIDRLVSGLGGIR